ncbi:hypothetical protein LX64_00847 [Chitinophaga skermanii]|uniref:Uncharacterized protein n=1 Tax=Chitinophaga skermanii TaxID=331697 RepID=A0A327QUZ6_9BACT|nr:hypothetical protein LX64_00847 [Chitinophaga skermanii]
MQFGSALNRLQMRAISGGLRETAILCNFFIIDSCERECPPKCKCDGFICFN